MPLTVGGGTISTKYQAVRNKLEAAIRSSEFAIGDQLPPEQNLAELYGVSLMTARRVVCDMVADDLLERRARKGTFVRQHAFDKVTTTTLNLVVAAYETSFQRNFLNQGMQQAAQKGWRGNVIRLARGQQDAAVRAIQDGELALLMLEEFQPQSALGLAVRGARGKAIWIGADVTKSGVPSIFVDVSHVFEIVVEYLRNQGHQNIVLLDQKISDNFTERHALAWQKATAALYSAKEANESMIHLETPLFQCPSFDAYAAVGQLLSQRKPRPTALVGFGEEITQGALAACRTAGFNVPEDISVINILDAPSMVFTYPPMTSVDVNFKKQVQIAMEILDTAINGEVPSADLHAVEPLLIERESVVPRRT